MDYLGPVMIEPAAMVFGALEALIGYISSREGRSRAFEPGIRIGPDIEKVSTRGWSAVEAGPKQKPEYAASRMNKPTVSTWDLTSRYSAVMLIVTVRRTYC